MVYRIRISRNHGSRQFYTGYGEGFTSKRKAREAAKRMKQIFGIEHYEVAKRKTRGNLRHIKHKFPLSRYKTQAQKGTSWRNHRKKK